MPIANTYGTTKNWASIYHQSIAALLLLLVSFSAQGQLVISAPPAGPNYTQLVQNFFVGGGVTVSNVTYTGSANAIGSFTNSGINNLQLQSGIILSTGNRATAAGPNNIGSAGTSLGTAGITQLNALAGSATYDGAQLQFDFVPQTAAVSFKFVFASEEYPEFVNGGYNDAFAFFINGPGFGGWTNLALVPSTSTPITINTINQLVNNTYYLSNAGSTTIQFDGLTRVLSANATVQPCSTYTLRIMIADGGDRFYDSAVFLGDNSFIGGPFTVSATSAYSDTSAYENCSPAYVNFSIPAAVGTPTTINYTIGGTATNGVDYTAIPTSVTIPAGQTSYQLNINALADALTEGMETLTINYTTGCGTQTITVYIRDVPPLSVVAGADINICAGAGPVNLSAQATGGLPPYNYTWNNGAGTGTGPSVNPANTTTYTVTVNGFCSNITATDQQVVNVNQIPTSSFTTTAPACPGNPVNATYTGNAGANATYTWQTGTGVVSGSGQNISVTYPNPGNYNIALTVVENGCSSTVSTVPVLVYQYAVPAFTPPQPLCVGANGTVTYTGLAYPNATYNWNFGGGTIVSGSGAGPYQISWNSPGTKTISLSITWNGCTSQPVTQQVDVYAIPTANFITGGAICEGSAVVVNYTGSADPTTATFTWDFDGGTIATNPAGQDYTIQYAGAGSYTIELTVTENGCTSQPFTSPVTVNAIPTSTFTAPQQLCVNTNGQVTFNGSASATATFTWNMDGGTIISGANAGPITVSWATAGTKHLTLQVSENGCVGPTETFDVTVNAYPVASFTATTNLCLGQPSDVQFNGTAGAGATYAWNFDGGTNTTGATNAGPYAITWPAAGTYDIELTVTENGCTSPLATQQVVVGGFPFADAGADVTVCSGQPVQIGAAPQANSVYQWITNLTDIVDPTQSQQQFTPTNTLSPVAPEVRVYTLQVDQNGCISTDDVTVTINPQPVATFTPPVAQCLSTNSFNFTAQGTFSTSASFAWDFGANANPLASAQQNPSGIVFGTTGLQSVTFTIDDYGCTDSYTADIEILPEPVVDFVAAPLEGCAPLRVNFTDLSGYGSNASYEWKFGDGGTSTDQNPLYTYLDANTYDVSLTVTVGAGCSTTLTLQNYIEVHPIPIASFNVSSTQLDFLAPFVSITNTSTGGSNISCFYDMGDDLGLLYECDPTYTYLNIGEYIITQYIQNEFGCKDTATQRINVIPSSALYIPNAFTPDGDNLNDIFLAKGASIKKFTMYIFNRWGERIFVSKDLNNGWDGTGSDNKLCPNDVYIYRVYYEDIKGEEHSVIGHVSLLR